MPKLLESQFGTGSNNPAEWSPAHLGIRCEETYVLTQTAKALLLSDLIDIEPEESPPIWGKTRQDIKHFFSKL